MTTSTAMSRAEQLIRLQEGIDAYNTQFSFKPGDVIELKPFLRNKRLPDYGQPIIVTEVLDCPIQGTNTKTDPGSAHFAESLDIRCGVLDEDGDLLFFYYDSRRFMPFKNTNE